MNAIGRTHVRFKRASVGSNGILECKFLSENAHRAVTISVASLLNVKHTNAEARSG
jgi:hypothetical protein